MSLLYNTLYNIFDIVFCLLLSLKRYFGKQINNVNAPRKQLRSRLSEIQLKLFSRALILKLPLSSLACTRHALILLSRFHWLKVYESERLYVSDLWPLTEFSQYILDILYLLAARNNFSARRDSRAGIETSCGTEKISG